MVTRKLGNTVEVDIHGLTESDAKRQLEQFLSRADASLQEVVVIHGYHNGQILRDMVRLKYFFALGGGSAFFFLMRVGKREKIGGFP